MGNLDTKHLLYSLVLLAFFGSLLASASLAYQTFQGASGSSAPR